MLLLLLAAAAAAGRCCCLTPERVPPRVEALTRGWVRSARCSCAANRREGADAPAARKASIFRGEVPEGRMPGLIPFTTVEYEEPLADTLFDRALLHGWLSCIGAGSRTSLRASGARQHGSTAARRACVCARGRDGRRRGGTCAGGAGACVCRVSQTG